MLKKNIRPLVYLGFVIFSLAFVVSCEKDFADIGSTIIKNDRFSTDSETVEILVTGKDIERVRADGLSLTARNLNQYLLGVYNNSNYKKIEASIISQLQIPPNNEGDDLKVTKEYGADTTVVTTMDAVFLRVPYQATLNETTSSGPDYTLDSIIGDQNVAFTLNVFRLSTFLNSLNPLNPSQQNSFESDHIYDAFPETLNETVDFPLMPNKLDTIQIIERSLSTGNVYDTDTIRYANSLPYISIPLKKDRIKELFLDQYETSDFDSQDAFNNYFRGIKIEAQGNDGAMLSLNLTSTSLRPSIDIYYTNTVFVGGSVIDTIKKNDISYFSGIINNSYVMTGGNAPASNNIPVQGTAGSMAQVEISADGLEELKTKNVLINDATLTLYVDQDIVGSDTIATPFRLFLYKDGVINATANPTQITDVFTEGIDQIGGSLKLDDSGKPDKYEFKITSYISELISGNTDLQPLGIKVFNNPTDLPSSALDTVVRTHNWNPKAVMLLDHQSTNGVRRAQLKISYSQKTENN